MQTTIKPFVLGNQNAKQRKYIVNTVFSPTIIESFTSELKLIKSIFLNLKILNMNGFFFVIEHFAKHLIVILKPNYCVYL